MGSREEHATFDELVYEENEEEHLPAGWGPRRMSEPLDAEPSSAAAVAAAGGPQPCDAALRVLFLLDITSSMEEEVKGAMQGRYARPGVHVRSQQRA